MISRETKNIRSVPIKGFLNSARIGFLLTDAGAYRTMVSRGNTRIEWSFGSKRESFARYTNFLFTEYINTPLRTIFVTVNSVRLQQYRLKTVALPIFNIYRDLFYRYDLNTNRWKKIVPNNILELINPVVLAFIIIGDGNFNVNRIRIYLNVFTKQEVDIICEAVQVRPGIEAVVRHDRNNQYMIVIPSKELEKTRTIVKPHLHESIIYRIGC